MDSEPISTVANRIAAHRIFLTMPRVRLGWREWSILTGRSCGDRIFLRLDRGPPSKECIFMLGTYGKWSDMGGDYNDSNGNFPVCPIACLKCNNRGD